MFEKQTKEAYKPAKVKFFSIRPMNVLCQSDPTYGGGTEPMDEIWYEGEED